MKKREIIRDDIGVIGANIRRIRLARGFKQTELVGKLELMDVPITRVTLVKIEHSQLNVTLSQLRAIKLCLDTTFDELLNPPEDSLE